MDSAKPDAPRATPNTEKTGIFRRPTGLAGGASDPREKLPGPFRASEKPPGAFGAREKPPAAARHERRGASASTGGAASGTDSMAELRVATLEDSELGTVRYDARGNPVWEWHVDVPSRRRDDTTVDLLRCLDTVDLRLVEDTGEVPGAGRGMDPYDHG